eukprot:539909_1
MTSYIFDINHDSDHAHEKDRMSYIDLIYLDDINEDIKCCSRFISINVIKFLDVNYNGINDKCKHGINTYDIIDNNISVGCGLCPIKNYHKTIMKLGNSWHNELLGYIEVINNGKLSNWCLNMERGLGTMCDICLVGFHHMSYYYLCQSQIELQHAMCLPCMNRNVLQYKRLQSTLNDLYFIHKLDQFCILQIVYCLVGFISLND